MSEVAHATLEISMGRGESSKFWDMRITEKTRAAIFAWQAGLERDSIIKSCAGTLEDMCLYAIGAYEEEEVDNGI